MRIATQWQLLAQHMHVGPEIELFDIEDCWMMQGRCTGSAAYMQWRNRADVAAATARWCR